MVEENRVDGLLVATLKDEDNLAHLRDLSVPTVLVNQEAAGFPTPVLSDEVTAAQMAARYLIGHGHRRIAHLAGNLTRFNAHLRLEGYAMRYPKKGR